MSSCWPHDAEVAGSAVADFILVISDSRRWRWCRRGPSYGGFGNSPIETELTLVGARAASPIRIARVCAKPTGRLDLISLPMPPI